MRKDVSMKDYVIFTDSGCDIEPYILAEWGVYHKSLTFRFNDSDKEYSNGDMNIADFYQKMRDGGVAKTSAINTQTFKDAFEALLKEGKDVLYIGFSSGLSTTYNSAASAADMLAKEYSDNKVVVVDSLGASAGLGLLVKLAVDEKNSGKSIDEVAAFVEDIKLKMCHWFTVEDLVYLKRGGRISPTLAFVGNMLGIKPVLHVDDEGHLVNVTKVRGRKPSIAALADKYTELADESYGKVYISHGDCLADAEYLASLIEKKHGVKTEIITYVGSVIGAHSGPGTLALFFVSRSDAQR